MLKLPPDRSVSSKTLGLGKIVNSPRGNDLLCVDRALVYESHIKRLIARQPKWAFAPFGLAIIANGKRLYLDYWNRPICWVSKDGHSVILRADTLVVFSHIADLHMNLDGEYDPSGLQRVKSTIEKFGLAAELQNRWDLYKCGRLPGSSYGARP